MKYLLSTIILLSLSFSIHGQILFEKGYYITNDGDEINCFIKNIDWKNNPTSILIKNKVSDKEFKKLDIKNIKEFSVIGISKFERHTISIDRSSSEIDKLTPFKSPEFNEETLFLRVITKGNASLYKYKDSNLIRFFFSKDNSPLQQLIYKKYKNVSQNFDQIRYNNTFRQQLIVNLKCNTVKDKTIKKAKYTTSDLVNLFEQYNLCKGGMSETFLNKQKREKFHLTVKSGISYNTFELFSPTGNFDMKFKDKIGYIIGLDAEIVLPFNKNKWTIFTEPTYLRYKNNKTITYYPFNIQSIEVTTNVDVTLQTLELPFGLRYYFFLNEKSKIYIAGAINLNIPIGESKNYISSTDTGIIFLDDVGSDLSFVVHTGYRFNNRFGTEFRCNFLKSATSNYLSWGSTLNNYSLNLTYTMF